MYLMLVYIPKTIESRRGRVIEKINKYHGTGVQSRGFNYTDMQKEREENGRRQVATH